MGSERKVVMNGRGGMNVTCSASAETDVSNTLMHFSNSKYIHSHTAHR